ncbi:MAG TPA: hypothetical protein VF824_01275 [Thermoanaerobaculia bacterium]
MALSSIRRAAADAKPYLGADVRIAARPQPIPNSTKYRDAGAKPATGRSGSAAIQARALRGLTQTDIDVTTGTFDGTQPAGKLDKVQIKVLNGHGDAIVTDNYRKGTLNGGTGTFAYDWPSRGEKVQVQANVSGIDPKRTDVVTVSTNVALRPDLKVTDITAVSQATLGASIDIAALVRESNGDLGARANCVLTIDGAVADRADGIWVDAGDAVTCQFRHTFTTLGTKQLEVSVTNVAPADYDSANNSKSATIEIVNPALRVPIWYDVIASDSISEQISHNTDHQQFESYDPWYASWISDSESDSRMEQHSVYYQADLNSTVALAFPVTIESSLTSDGQLFSFPSFTIDAPNYTYSYAGYSEECGETYDNSRWYRACHQHDDASSLDGMTVSTSVRGGSVTYDGRTVGSIRYPDLGVEYVYESNYGPFTDSMDDPLHPLPETLGNNLRVRVVMSDAADHHFDVEGAVQLDAYGPVSYSYDLPCMTYDYSYDYGRYSGNSCWHTDTTDSGRSGIAFGYIEQ